MKKIIVMLFLSAIIFFACQVAKEDSIEGTWHATHALGVPVSDGYYFEFRSNGSFSRDSNESDLFKSNAYVIGTYDLSANGDLKLKPNTSISGDDTTYTYTAYTLGNTMYLYSSGVEAGRLEKL